MPTPSPPVTTDRKTHPAERAHVRNPLHVSSSNEWPAASRRRTPGSSTLHPLFPPVVHAGRSVQEENYVSPTCKPRQFKKVNRIYIGVLSSTTFTYSYVFMLESFLDLSECDRTLTHSVLLSQTLSVQIICILLKPADCLLWVLVSRRQWDKH